ncbi:MAG: S49 family peptidase [Anaerolineales bacterium]|nr:S49 family peptidase [Anaerolineales bacterium]
MSEYIPPPEPPKPKRKTSAGRFTIGCLFWVILPLVIGAVVAFYAIPKPAVGIIRLREDIWTLSAELVNLEIDAARQDERIKAVVFQIDSPGGEVVATQAIYLELQELRTRMPVVGSIDTMAASGGYYVAMATDYLYAKPSSTIGNVGVWGYFPYNIGVNDVVLASGPFKLTASNDQAFLREIEGIKQEFLATVVTQRGSRLVITPVELSQGLAYPGRNALSMGMIDALGSQSEAVAKAAELAGLREYDVVDLEETVLDAFLEKYYYGELTWSGAADPLTGERTLPPGIYLLYDLILRGEK